MWEVGDQAPFFSHCNLHCAFCQNPDIAHGGTGREISDEAERYNLSTAADYPQKAKSAILEMLRQTGNLINDKQGIAISGLMIRHLRQEPMSILWLSTARNIWRINTNPLPGLSCARNLLKRCNGQ